MKTIRLLVPFLLVVWSLPVYAQERSGQERGQHRHNHDDSPEGRQRRLDRAMSMLKWLDTNRNGVIEASEVSGGRKGYFEGMLRRYGLEPNLPMSIESIQGAAVKYYSSPSPSSGSTPSPAKPTSPPPSSATPSRPAEARASSSSTSPSGGSSVAGFGVGSGGSSPSPTAFGSNSSSAASSGANSLEYRLRAYAARLFQQCDTNKNNLLEKSEWGQMSTDPSPADRNRDGIITLDELTDWVIAKATGRATESSVATSSSTPPAAASTVGTAAPAAPPRPKTGRFLTASERLPKDLPEWFAQKDLNHDGQITLAEYAPTLNEAAVAEFARYDLNHDGCITPSECLKSTRTAATR